MRRIRRLWFMTRAVLGVLTMLGGVGWMLFILLGLYAQSDPKPIHFLALILLPCGALLIGLGGEISLRRGKRKQLSFFVRRERPSHCH